MEIEVRKATSEDVPVIVELVAGYPSAARWRS